MVYKFSRDFALEYSCRTVFDSILCIVINILLYLGYNPCRSNVFDRLPWDLWKISNSAPNPPGKTDSGPTLYTSIRTGPPHTDCTSDFAADCINCSATRGRRSPARSPWSAATPSSPDRRRLPRYHRRRRRRHHRRRLPRPRRHPRRRLALSSRTGTSWGWGNAARWSSNWPNPRSWCRRPSSRSACSARWLFGGRAVGWTLAVGPATRDWVGRAPPRRDSARSPVRRWATTPAVFGSPAWCGCWRRARCPVGWCRGRRPRVVRAETGRLVVSGALFGVFAPCLFCTWGRICFYRRASYPLAPL